MADMMLCRILMFVWPFGEPHYGVLFRGGLWRMDDASQPLFPKHPQQLARRPNPYNASKQAMS